MLICNCLVINELRLGFEGFLLHTRVCIRAWDTRLMCTRVCIRRIPLQLKGGIG